MSVEAEQGVSVGEVSLPSTPQGVGDLADVAWVVAHALGIGAGVVSVSFVPTGVA